MADTSLPIRLIINADDLGSSPGRDQGILRAFREGILTSASLLANGPSFQGAAQAAMAEGLPVGVHLNVSEGRPLTAPIGGLTLRNGEFPGKWEARRRLATGHIDSEALRRELSTQIQRVLDTGIVPDHLDTHQHLFLFPVITEAVLQTCRDFGICSVRLPCPAEPSSIDPGEELGLEMTLYRHLAHACRETVGRARVAVPDGLFGMPLLGRLDESSLSECLCGMPPGTWELMVHPGYPDAADPFGGPEREREVSALLSPKVRSVLIEMNIAPITFRALTCAS